ncbi:MAG: hypothetical protein MI742_10140 [Desulfobacterales bacterium]|nr:hypothetical protein [Desulfobacterales bacterium]
MLTRIRIPLLVVLFTLFATPQLHALWDFERPLENTDPLMGTWASASATYVAGFNGKVFRYNGSEWSSITTPVLESANLFCIYGTSESNIYVGGYRMGPPRFDDNGDNLIDKYDNPSRYGVIFHYNGSDWEELIPGYPESSPYFTSSIVSIWSDGEHAVYFAGGKQTQKNTSAPMGVCLKLSGSTFTPLIGTTTLIPYAEDASTATLIPTINSIRGNANTLYFTCSNGIILQLNRTTDRITVMKSMANSLDFMDILEIEGRIYAVGSDTNGYVFTWHEEHGWIPMGLNNSQPHPLLAIAGKPASGTTPALIVATGSYGKTFILDTKDGIWKENISGSSNHINALRLNPHTGKFMAVATTGEVYTFAEQDANTSYILPEPKSGLGTLEDGVLGLNVTLTDFALGRIWKREWHFGNGNHHDPVSAMGKLYSTTSEDQNTALQIEATPGSDGNRELRIYKCENCTPYVNLESNIIKLYIRPGITSQRSIQEVLEAHATISKVTPLHPDQAWLIKGTNYDSVTLTGGRDDEDLYVNTETTGETYHTANHTYKDKGTYTARLRVYRENIAYLGGTLQLIGQRENGAGITVNVMGKAIDSLPVKGCLGGLINLEAETALTVILTQNPNLDVGTAITSVFSDPTLTLTLPPETKVNEVIESLTASDKITSATFNTDNTEGVKESEISTKVWSYGLAAKLTKGSTPAAGALGGVIAIIAKPGTKGNLTVELATAPNAEEIDATLTTSTLHITLPTDTTIDEIVTHLKDEAPANTIVKEAFLVTQNYQGENGTPLVGTDIWDLETLDSSVNLKGGSHFIDVDYTHPTITVAIENKLTTSTDIARELSKLKEDSREDEPKSVFKGIYDMIPGKPWDADDNATYSKHKIEMPGVTWEDATHDVRLFKPEDFNFTHTPESARVSSNITFQNTSIPDIEIRTCEWAVFRLLPSGEYETKTTVKSTTGTGTANVSGLGTYSLGFKATLTDGSIMTMEKEDALTIKGEDAGHSSLQGANGCFIQTVGP